jgi:glycerol kinase
MLFPFNIQANRDSLCAVCRREDARGLIVGLTGFNTKAHIVRAALEAAAFQVSLIERCATQRNATLYNTIQYDAMQRNAIQCGASIIDCQE